MASLRIAGILAALGAIAAWAEDPYLGRIKAIKCVGCRPDVVEIIVHDPIDVRDFEIHVKLADYYKVVSPLPGKNIHDKGSCFYWFEYPKGATPPGREKPAAKPLPAVNPTDTAAAPDSAKADSAAIPPPLPPEPEGPPPKESRCVPYTRPGPPPPSKEPR